MRYDSKIRSFALLFLLLAASSLGSSCTSIDARLAQDKNAMTAEREKIRAKYKFIILESEKNLSAKHELAIKELEKRQEALYTENEQQKKFIDYLQKNSKPTPTPPPRFP